MQDEQKIRQIIKEEMGNFFNMTNYNFDKNIKIQDYRNIAVGRTNGTMIATEGGASGQKLGFWGVVPKVQPSAISDPTGGATQDAEARTKIIQIVDALQSIGLIA